MTTVGPTPDVGPGAVSLSDLMQLGIPALNAMASGQTPSIAPSYMVVGALSALTQQQRGQMQPQQQGTVKSRVMQQAQGIGGIPVQGNVGTPGQGMPGAPQARPGMPGIPGGAMPGAANTASPGASPQIPIQQSGGAPVFHAAGGGAVRHFDGGGSSYLSTGSVGSPSVPQLTEAQRYSRDNLNAIPGDMLSAIGNYWDQFLAGSNFAPKSTNPAYDPNSTSLLPSGAALHGNPAYNPNYTSLLPPPTASYSNEGRNSTPPQDTDSASGLPAVAPPEANPYKRYSPDKLATFDTSTPVRPANSDYTVSNVPSSSETQKSLDQYRTANPQRLADYQKMADNAGTAAWLQQMAAPHGGGLGASIGPAYGADLNAQNGVVQQRMQYEDNREKMAAEL